MHWKDVICVFVFAKIKENRWIQVLFFRTVCPMYELLLLDVYGFCWILAECVSNARPMHIILELFSYISYFYVRDQYFKYVPLYDIRGPIFDQVWRIIIILWIFDVIKLIVFCFNLFLTHIVIGSVAVPRLKQTKLVSLNQNLNIKHPLVCIANKDTQILELFLNSSNN